MLCCAGILQPTSLPSIMSFCDIRIIQPAKRTELNGEDLLFWPLCVWVAFWRSFTFPSRSSCCSFFHSYSFSSLIPSVHIKLFAHLEVQLSVWIPFCLSTHRRWGTQRDCAFLWSRLSAWDWRVRGESDVLPVRRIILVRQTGEGKRIIQK